MAAGPEAWDRVRALAGSWLGLAVLFGWTWSFAFHLLNGIRHLVQDAGFGFSIPAVHPQRLAVGDRQPAADRADLGRVATRGGWRMNRALPHAAERSRADWARRRRARTTSWSSASPRSR